MKNLYSDDLCKEEEMFVISSSFFAQAEEKNKIKLITMIESLRNEYFIQPIEVSTSWLVCLNKDASKPENRDNIRGIAVNDIIYIEGIGLRRSL